ncbi:hypothetical protein MIV123L [Invertebrate iridescent virus 3]|uniref:Uncharacterized protein 123L n=1 Tax=Invertebrate iridescent virus 3 TaxID=345201 RepID=123L_IIV3|nr:hypothetical protein MIV123L [Invertebrate iridescent virus 3]Q196T7.1 RecName: Full=Uncharacterized protein 123L [Invertebrate iridescent virus 3]ABF82153.1 hypothetical protein MIV123L [Invertebrate iridescent virus 3]
MNSCRVAPTPHEVTIDPGPSVLLQVEKLWLKYHELQTLYYSAYVESFHFRYFHIEALRYLKLYNNFKTVCRLLERVKRLLSLKYATFTPEMGGGGCGGGCGGGDVPSTLGSEELKVLVNYKDIKKFLDTNNLWSVVESS